MKPVNVPSNFKNILHFPVLVKYVLWNLKKEKTLDFDLGQQDALFTENAPEVGSFYPSRGSTTECSKESK